MKYHVVQINETVHDIARKYQISVEEIMKLNRHITSPEYIIPGMKLRLPVLTEEVSEELKDNFLDIEKYYPKIEDFKDDLTETNDYNNDNKNILDNNVSNQQPNYIPPFSNYYNYYNPYMYQTPYYYYPLNNYPRVIPIEPLSTTSSLVEEKPSTERQLFTPPYPLNQQIEDDFTSSNVNYETKPLKADLRDFVKKNTKIRKKPKDN